jgi:hypothetical protein
MGPKERADSTAVTRAFERATGKLAERAPADGRPAPGDCVAGTAGAVPAAGIRTRM